MDLIKDAYNVPIWTGTYDDRGCLETSSDALNHETSYGYDVLDRLNLISDPLFHVTTMDYDALGREIQKTDAASEVSSRQYNNLGLVTSLTDQNNQITTFAHDAAGRLTTITYPDLKTVTYGYDADSRLTTVTDWANRVTSYTYDNNNRLTHTSRADGSYEDYVYNSAGQLTEYSDHDSQNALISQVLYGYNEDGRLISETQTNAGGHTETNTYNSVERLTDQQVIENGQPKDSYAYTYDAGGNVTGAALNAVLDTYTYTDANQLSTYNGTPVTHDADGNITNATIDGTAITYDFDVRSRLTAAGDFTFAYDLQNRRILKTENTITTTYLQNPLTALPQVLSKTLDGTSTYYIYGLGLIAEEAGADYKIYHYDQRGSTTALTDSTGLVTDTYDYGPYGELINHTGTSQVDYLYNGRDGVITDSEDLYYMRARYYSTDLRRFLSEDNYAGKYDNILGMNLYGYVNGNPVQYVDPSGNDGELTGDKNFESPFLIGATNFLIVDDVKTMMDPNASAFEKALIFLSNVPVLKGAKVVGKVEKSLLKFNLQMFASKGGAEKIIKNIDDGLNFSVKAGDHMDDAARFVPVQTLQDAIKSTKGLPDPRGSDALMHYTTINIGKKTYNLEVLYDAATNTVYHFEYARKAMGNLPALPK